jgi:3-deoxy-D-manno-octulosonic-acid transferase
VIALYYALLALLAPILLPGLALYLLASPRRRRGVVERLRPLGANTQNGVWLQAASLGEAEASAPLIRALLEARIPVVATTLTETGRARMRARFPELPVRLAPLDLPGLVHRSLRRARPRALVLIETELWPTLIAASARAGTRVLMLSARISDRTYPRYRLARPLFASLLRRVHRIAAQTEEDARRLIALGACERRVEVGGDLKLDAAGAESASQELLDAVGPGPWLLGGSTHAGEELALLEAWERLRAAGAKLRLVLVPRHPERAPEVLALAGARGHDAGLRSSGAAECEVVVVDSAGELRALYPHAALVFSGGTLAPVGGHNLLEPVLAGRVVVLGPHAQNQRAQVRVLEPLGVLHRVDSAAALRETLIALWSNAERDAPALRAASELACHRGATARALAQILAALRDPGGP